ncbi:MAG: tetratricopeptide repeat protein [Robiginitomaculum sp.]|nr:tetratricopeptide repeat protein [Robiginitomaculum sp.]
MANSNYKDLHNQGGKNAAVLQQADQLLGKHIAECWPDPQTIAQLSAQGEDFPKRVAAHVVKTISLRIETHGVFDESHANFRQVAHDFAIDTVVAAMMAALQDDKYFRQLQPHLLMENLKLSSQTLQAVQDLAENQDNWQNVLKLVNDDFLQTVTRIDQTTQEILDKVKRSLELQEAQSGIALDPQSKASIVETIKGLLNAGKGARRSAGEKLIASPPDPAGAVVDLKQLVAQQEDAVADAAQTWLDIGNIAYLNDTEEALEAFERVTQLTPNNPKGWNQLGHLLRRVGDLSAAKTAYDKVLALSETMADKAWQADALGNLGIVEKTRGNLDAAMEYYQQALALNSQLGRKKGMAAALGNLGVVEEMRGNLDAAVDYHLQALALHSQLGGKEGMAANYGNLGIVEKTRGNLDAAVEYYQKSLTLEKALGRKEGMASDYGNLGNVEQIRGDLEAACAYWRQSYDLFAEVGAAPEIEQVGNWLRDAGCSK